MADRQEPEAMSGEPEQARRPITIRIDTRTIVLVVAIVAGAYLLFRIPHFWLIVLTAVVLATAIDKPVAAMQARGVPRAVGILMIYIVLSGLVIAAAGALAPIVAGDVRALERELPGYIDRIQQVTGGLVSGVPETFSLASLEAAARGHASALASGITEISVGVGRSAFYVFVTFVVAFFLAIEPGTILSQAERWVAPRHRGRVARVIANIHERIGTWARGQLLIAIIFGLLMGTGLRLIGVPYAWSLGVIAGILEVFPYVGGAITVVLAGLSAATIGIPQVVAVLVLYLVLVNIESHILAPVLYGRVLGLPPVAILLALLAGVELLGILGALLAVPLTVIVWAVVEEFAPRFAAGKTARRQDG